MIRANRSDSAARSTRSPREKPTASAASRTRTSAYRKAALVISLRKLSRMIGRPIQNDTTVATATNSSTIQNSAFGTVTPKNVKGPARFHRIGVNATTDTIE